MILQSPQVKVCKIVSDEVKAGFLKFSDFKYSDFITSFLKVSSSSVPHVRNNFFILRVDAFLLI